MLTIMIVENLIDTAGVISGKFLIDCQSLPKGVLSVSQVKSVKGGVVQIKMVDMTLSDDFDLKRSHNGLTKHSNIELPSFDNCPIYNHCN